MKQAICQLESVSPYGQSKRIFTPKIDRETHDEYENRTWRERCHVDEEGFVFIPPMPFKRSLEEAAKCFSLQIPGKGKSTYTKHYEMGMFVMDSVPLNVKQADIKGLTISVPSDGKPGGDKQVLKTFPYVDHWKGEVIYHILDDTITEKAFAYHLEKAGSFIGIGYWRPRRRGLWGRYKATSIKWVDIK